MKYKPVKREVAKALIEATKGRFFVCSFTKKDGTIRHMLARIGVKTWTDKDGEIQHVKGTTSGPGVFDALKYGLFRVYDRHAQSYRMINLDTLQTLKCGKCLEL